jgi:uncharacterized NAD-dependent epimerase/dehydratase family protein
MENSAIVLTDGQLHEYYGKTAHGLITGMSRYPIQAVIDHTHAGKDAGEVIDGKNRNIPVFSSIDEALKKLHRKPTHCIIGVATRGGVITASLQSALKTAVKSQLCIVNGLHEQVAEHPNLKPLIAQYKAKVIDIRKPKHFKELQTWQGNIQNIRTPRIAVLGIDCAIGKRTTTQMLYTQCRRSGISTEMIYTGQTGWLQGFRYGFIFDSTLNDFVSGELEHAVVSCVKEAQPELILFEGQSALRNPSGPCGAEFICSGGARGVILQYVPGRKYFNHGDKVFYPLPSLTEEIELIKLYGAKVLAVTLNTSSLNGETWQSAKLRINDETGLSVICPREEGVDFLIPIVKSYIEQHNSPEVVNEN